MEAGTSGFPRKVCRLFLDAPVIPGYIWAYDLPPFWGRTILSLWVRAQEHAHQSESQSEQEEDTVERVEGGEEREMRRQGCRERVSWWRT